MADERYELSGNTVHVTNRDGDYEVWLNTEVADFDGLCIGAARERDDAITQAEEVLSDALWAIRRAQRNAPHD